VLATSRLPLRRANEHTYAVSPLAIEAAVELFERSARSGVPAFAISDANRASVTQLCERLDCLPLAIELAAPRTRVAGPDLLLRHLDRQLELLRAREPVVEERHASLDAALAWSYGLLAPDQQRTFRALGVFAGSFDADAATAVADGDPVDVIDCLEDLLDHHLVRRADDAPRFSLLRTVRAFALDQLGRAGETRERTAAHAAYYADAAARDATQLRGADQLGALRRLTDARDDLRVALAWLLDQDPTVGVELAIALAPYWDATSALTEGRDWLGRALTVEAASWFPTASAQTWASYLAALQGDCVSADRLATAALDTWTAHGMEAGRGYALLMLGFTAVERGARDEGERLLTASVEALERGDDRWGMARPLNNLGELARMRGELDRAERLHSQALAIVRATNDLVSQPNMLCGLGHVQLRRGHADAARAVGREAIEISETLGNVLGTVSALELLGLADVDDDPERAARLLGAAQALRERIGAPIESRDHEELESARDRLGATSGWQAGAAAALHEVVRFACRA
jgi:non-specific serine/threonine protein kinase